MTRRSKKRESILECLISTDTHPSAEWIYNKLKPVYPDLSLATVYRNIGELIESGKVKSVGVVSGKERFDGKTFPHTHAVCSVCGKVIDVMGVDIPEDLIEKAKKNSGFDVSCSNLQFIGICEECKKKGV